MSIVNKLRLPAAALCGLLLAASFQSTARADTAPQPSAPASAPASGPSGPSSSAALSGSHSGPWAILLPVAYPYPCFEIKGQSTANNANAQIGYCNANPDRHYQEWTMYNITGSYWQVINYHSGKCLAPKYGGSATGTAIVQETCLNSAQTYQQWSLVFVYTGTETDESDYYMFVNRANGKCINSQGHRNAGTLLLLVPCASYDDHYNDIFTWWAADA